MKRPLQLAAIASLAFTLDSSATVHYVDLNCTNPVSPYAGWGTAATNIQDAIDFSTNGDVVLVTNAVYRGGIVVTNALTVRSVSGASVTWIDGNSTNSCAILADGAVLTGFTLTNGYSWYGAGVRCASANVLVTDCLIVSNVCSGNFGGGAYSGTLSNCTLRANTCRTINGLGFGGGAAASVLNNCVVSGNLSGAGGGTYLCTIHRCILRDNQANGGGGDYASALDDCLIINNTVFYDYRIDNCAYGGGLYGSHATNCTIVNNTAAPSRATPPSGGGAFIATLNNCIIYGNKYGAGAVDNAVGGILYNCCTIPLPAGGADNFTNEPLFVNLAGGDFHLQSNSPCINSGNNDYVTSATDLDGNPRIVGGTVDIGAYEYQVPLYFLLSPANQNVLAGSNFVLSASAVGNQPIFQWWFNGTPLANGGRIAGADSNSLTVSQSQTNDTGSYWVTASNSFGLATSAVAMVTVFQVPVIITSQPTNQIVLAGSNATFKVVATGLVPPTYLWYSNGIALANGGRISGATSPTLTISGVQTNDNGAAYQVVVTNNYGAATSSVATLTVLAPATITSQPTSQTVLLGSNVSFAVTATGSALGYQWFLNGMPLVDDGRISGSSAPTLSIANVQNNDVGGYIAIVTNRLSSATSRTASLTPQASLAPCVRYVALTSIHPLPPYLDWSTAATNIQDAVDAAVAGDSVVVSNGVYGVGGRAVYGAATNRLTVDKAVVVQGANGPFSTVIQGGSSRQLKDGSNIRCAYLTNGAALIGFTLTNGGTLSSTNVYLEASGGGVWCEGSGAVISNCVFSGNYAAKFGGGAFRGTLVNCLLTNNSASQGGGAFSNVLLNCTLTKNFASYQSLNAGGGALTCALSNCLLVANSCYGGGGGAAVSTLSCCVLSNNSAGYGGGLAAGVADHSLISSNRASVYGGGAYSNFLNNCVVKNNLAGNAGGGTYNNILLGCTVVSNSVADGGGIWGGASTNSIIYYNGGNNIENCQLIAYTCSFPLGTITNEPLFINLAGGNFNLSSNSPCINAGNNACVTSTIDLDGNERIVGGTVDIGAYEYQTPVSMISYAWLQQYGLPITTNTDAADSDGDGMNNWQEWKTGTNPTNAASVMKMTSAAPANNPAGLVVTWQSVSGISYFLQSSTNLGAQPAFFTIQSNIVGQTGTTSCTDTNAVGSGPYFFRVGVQ